jgi:hypothetical protein
MAIRGKAVRHRHVNLVDLIEWGGGAVEKTEVKKYECSVALKSLVNIARKLTRFSGTILMSM